MGRNCPGKPNGATGHCLVTAIETSTWIYLGVDNLKRAKFEIVEGLKPGGVAVFNKAAGEEDLIRWAKEINVKSVVYEAGGKGRK